jgi:hypothetical protein
MADHQPSGNQKRFWRDPVKRVAVRAWRVLIYEAPSCQRQWNKQGVAPVVLDK